MYINFFFNFCNVQPFQGTKIMNFEMLEIRKRVQGHTTYNIVIVFGKEIKS